jgi:hypothetical protein
MMPRGDPKEPEMISRQQANAAAHRNAFKNMLAVAEPAVG